MIKMSRVSLDSVVSGLLDRRITPGLLQGGTVWPGAIIDVMKKRCVASA
jgi:hypothetical protein